MIANGQTVAFTRRERPDSNTVNLWSWDPGRNTETQVAGGVDTRARIVRASGTDIWLSVPDGNQTSARRFDARGMARPEEIVRVDGFPIWDVSADGKSFVFGRSSDLWLRQSGRPDRLLVHTSGRAVNAAFSPGGDWVLYLSNETGRNELYVSDTAGVTGRVRLTTDGATDGSWSHEGRTLYYRTLDGGFWRAAIGGGKNGPTFGPASRILSAPLPFNFSNRTHAVAPDGRFVVSVLADDVAARSSIVVLNWAAALKK